MISVYAVRVVSHDGKNIYENQCVFIKTPFNIDFDHKLFKMKLDYPLMIPRSTDVFFPAGVHKLFQDEDQNVWFTQDGKPLFQVEGTVVNDNVIVIEIKQSSKSKFVYLLRSNAYLFFRVRIPKPFAR
jgi:hypothetical protein